MKINLIYIGLILGLQLTLSGQQIPGLDEINQQIQEARENGDFRKLGETYYLRASANINSSIKQDEVLDDLQQSATYFRYVKDSVGYFTTRITIAEFHIKNQVYLDNAIQLLEPALEFFHDHSMTKLEAKSYTLLSKAYELKQEYEKALDNIIVASDLNKGINDTILQINNALGIANLLALQGKVENAIDINENTIQICQMVNDPNLYAESLYKMGYFHLKINRPHEALEFLMKADSIAPRSLDLKASIYKLLSESYESIGQMDKALNNQRKYAIVRDSLLNLERIITTNKLSVEYQTRDKEREISRLESEREFKQIQLDQQRRLLITLGLGIVAGLLAIFYIIRYYTQKISVSEILANQKEELNKQKIKELEDDVKIKSLESMVTGQEVERKRIATDLHDSLGGMLSTLKLQFDSLQYDYKKLNKDESYLHIHSLIDGACSEVRDIARNLKPSALENMGLEAAIRDLINRYKTGDQVEISFHSNHVDDLLKYESKLHLYRIVQELINNAFKHAQAKEIDVQLTAQKDELMLKVEDDGAGFNKDNVKMGLGLGNIQSRVNVLKGEITIDSIPNGGTSVIIYIPIERNQKLNGMPSSKEEDYKSKLT